MDLTFDNLQWLICHKTKTKQNQIKYLSSFDGLCILVAFVNLTSKIIEATNQDEKQLYLGLVSFFNGISTFGGCLIRIPPFFEEQK